MMTKTFHGFRLWAVPRFHRPDAIFCPEASPQEQTGSPPHQFATREMEESVREEVSLRPALTRETAL
jgi:hypothetical protein